MKYRALMTIPLLFAGMLATLSHGQQSVQPTVVGTWHLVRIESAGPDGKPSEASQPKGILIYTKDGHAAVQLMYPQTSLQNEFVHDGYEATFGTYDLDEGKHQLTYHIEGSATRERLVGTSETLHYDFPDGRHMIIRPTQPDQHWSVNWERY
ncbi:MAG: lipocalin-like domain-containing protein [Acidobacteriota bacterium]|nr:lipocalin-like domain-containing protein [Acidobacteriota bacterium]